MEEQGYTVIKEDFITFYHVKIPFSKSFCKEMSLQLKDKFIERMGMKHILDRFHYRLMVDRDFQETDIQVRNDKVYAQIYIRTPISFLQEITVLWESDDIEDKNNIHLMEISGKKVLFDFGDDFPFDELLGYTKPSRHIDKGTDGICFDIDLYIFTFPDVAINFITKEPLTDDDKKAIWQVFITYNKKKDAIDYLSDFKDNSIYLDYHIGSGKPEIYINELITLFQEVSRLKLNGKIDKIEIM